LAVTGHADPMVATATFDSVTVGSGGGTCTPESNTAFCSRLNKTCGTVTGNDNCGVSRTVSSCGTCTSPQTCGGGGTPNVCGGGSGGPVQIFLEAESGTGAGTAPMAIVSDASASGGKSIWNATTSSNLNPPTDGHVTYPFSVGSAGTWKLWGRFLVGPAQDSDDSLWVRIDNTAYAWDAVHNTASSDALVTYDLATGNHTLEIAYRENGLKIDRFLLT